jgi:enoyl-CoA hydratase/carnithine racemase
MADTLLYEKKDFVATITLNRPEKMNAYNGTKRRELAETLAQAEADDAVRAVILTGAGRAFCAGADMSEGRLEAREKACNSPSSMPWWAPPTPWRAASPPRHRCPCDK